MSRDEVMAAHVMYTYGWSISEVARSVWEKYGYSSPDACRRQLCKAFISYGLWVRTPKEVQGLRRGTCAGCGCRLDERTRACDTCSARHGARRRSGNYTTRFKSAKAGCTGCGCRYDRRTKGCAACRSRHHRRRKRYAAAAEAA